MNLNNTAPAPGAPDDPAPFAAPIARAVALSGLSRSAIYRAAGEGRIVLKKMGRSTLVDLGSLRTFLAGLPRATIRPPRAPRPAAAAPSPRK